MKITEWEMVECQPQEFEGLDGFGKDGNTVICLTCGFLFTSIEDLNAACPRS